MRVLAIDSSGLTATVAVVEDEQTIAEYIIQKSGEKMSHDLLMYQLFSL